jgi:uncharacterized protein
MRIPRGAVVRSPRSSKGEFVSALSTQGTPALEYGLDPLSFTKRGYYIYITEACNLRCNYCFVSDKANSRHLTKDMADKVLTFIKVDASNLKDTYVHFFGGEPLIRPAMVDYVAGQLRTWSEERKIKLKLGITTNGTLLTTQNCEMLKRHDIGVQLSLDGSKQGNDVHRQLMGGTQCGLPPAGAFGLVQIKNYFEYFGKGRPNCRMTLTIHNLPFLVQSIRELHAIGFKSFSIIPDSDCGAWTEAYLAQYEIEMTKVFDYWAANREIEVNTISQTMDKLASRAARPQLCQVGRSIVGITVDGDIYPCHDFSGKFASDPDERAKLLIGNVEKGFTPNQHRFSDLPTEKARSGNGYDCSTCWAKWVCGRGCPYMNYARSGDIFQVNSAYCATTRINAGLALRWMSVLDDYRFLRAKDIEAMRLKLARAVLNAAGGEEEAPFGRNKQGKALLPSPMKMRQLGFDPWADGGRSNGGQNGVARKPAQVLPAGQDAQTAMPRAQPGDCI